MIVTGYIQPKSFSIAQSIHMLSSLTGDAGRMETAATALWDTVKRTDSMRLARIRRADPELADRIEAVQRVMR